MLESVIYDEDILQSICEKLNGIINEILGFNPKFRYFNFENEDFYVISNKDKNSGNRRFDLNMRLYSNEEKCGFLYAYILWFSVNPKKMGLGSKVIKNIIELLKASAGVEFLLLHPDDNEVKYFWMKNHFLPVEGQIDKRIDINTRRILVYAV